MINLINESEFKIIDSEFLHNSYLGKIPSHMDMNGESSLKHLRNIIESEHGSENAIYIEFRRVRETYRRPLGNNTFHKPIPAYHIIWARMIVEMYYFYRNATLESSRIYFTMLEQEIDYSIRDSINILISKIRDYYFATEDELTKRQEEETNLVKSTTDQIRIKIEELFNKENQPSQTSSHTEESSHVEEREPLPDIVQVMQDINAGKISHTNVDWILQIKSFLKLQSVMPVRFPYVIWLWGFLGEIDNIQKRIDILSKFKEIAPKCFDDLNQASEFIKDCDSIIYIYRSALQYDVRNDIKIRHKWTDDRKCLNDLAHILCKEMVDPKFMVALAEEMHCIVEDAHHKHSMMELVLKSSQHMDKLSIDNIVEFAKQLYIAEGFRNLILHGEKDFLDIPALETFEPKLLKACFEEYIRLRSIQIKEIIEQDLTHYGDAEDLECLEYLLQKEEQLINRENGLEAFEGSLAYDAMWYPGRKKVLEMINVFHQYLQNKINKLKNVEGVGRAPIMNFNAPIGQVIANVENLNTTKE